MSRSRLLLRITILLIAATLLPLIRWTGATANALQSSDPVLVGAGDISSCNNNGDEITASLLDDIPGTVFAAGDLAYDSGTTWEFLNCYGPTWGRHKARTRPVPGNHEYYTANASGYFGYFGAAAGDPSKGYYSYDLGTWHIVALNSEVPVSVGSAQEKWLRSDLKSHPAACTLAYFHRPRFSSGPHGNNADMQPIWQDLYNAGADVVLNGHDHDYERFAPQKPDGTADPAYGIREFVVGTGGNGTYTFQTIQPNSLVRATGVLGVIKLTLHSNSFDWAFVPEPGKTFSDSGSAACHGTPGSATPTPLPTATPTPSAATLVKDTFTRTLSGAWGTADVGGTYTLSGTAGDFNVNGSAGTIGSAANVSHGAYLLSSQALDLDSTVRVSTDKIAQGGGQIAYIVARQVSPGNDYLARVRFPTDGTVRLQAAYELNGAPALLGSEVTVPGITHAANAYLRLRLQTTGTNPTTIRLRAWPDGQTEPTTWYYTVSDATTALQARGAVGLRTFLGAATNPPVQFAFDDWVVTTLP